MVRNKKSRKKAAKKIIKIVKKALRDTTYFREILKSAAK